MSEHPSIRCPACGLGAKDIAPDHDPFAGVGLFGHMQTIDISASCANGHNWFEHANGKERIRSGVVGAQGWADNAPWRKKP